MNVVVVLLVPLFVLTLASACTTETKAGDAGDAAGNAALVDASAPATDSGALASSGDAGTDASAPMDAGAPLDAGSAPVTDAGSKLGAIATPATDGSGGAPDRPASGKATAFDRVLAKPKVMPAGNYDAIKALVEKQTGHKITLVRKTAGKWLLLQFAPTAKGRDQGEQGKLVDVIKGMDEFAAAEGDRLMKVKTP